MAENKRSPLKDKPLRLPGQSLDERLEDVAYDKLLAPAFIAILLVVIAGSEWWRFWFPHPAAPWFYTIIAAAGVAFATFRGWKVWPELKQLRLARDGERTIGQHLEDLRRNGYHVFHDVLGIGFNVDHVLIGPSGLFTIETKTFSKRDGATVRFDGEQILVDGWEPDRDPVVQAKAQASWLRELLEGSSGKRFPVRPVILFPGWYVDQPPGTKRDVWVLNPKALATFLENERTSLPPEDVKLAAFHLSRYVRTTEAQKNS